MPDTRETNRLDDLSLAERRRVLGPEVAIAITALVDLHRATAHEGGGRYLKAARVLGDDLVSSILGPQDGTDR